MRRLGIIPAIAAAFALALAPPVQAQRIAGARPDLASDEGGLWAVSDKTEAEAKASAELNADPLLNDYVREVACKVAAEYCGDIRVYVMDRPFFNATMAPNGYTEVWSGLLLRAADEAELAFVLGHEVSHFTQDHSVSAWRAHKNRANATLAVSVGIAVIGAVAAVQAPTSEAAQSIVDTVGNLVDVLYLAQVAAYFRFSREHEAEADRLGLERASAAGYSPHAGPSIWRSLEAETKASEFKRVRERPARTNIFDSHPIVLERIANLEEQARALPAEGARPSARHRAAIRPHLTSWLRDDLRRRDFGQTLFLIDRLAAGGEDLGVLNYFRGEAYRLRRGEGDLDQARAAYLAAAAHPDAPVAVWRELGDLRRRERDFEGARAAYETYLAKAPDAGDAWMVQDSLDSLNKGS